MSVFGIVKRSIDVVGSVGTSVEPHRPVNMEFDSKAHISAGYIYSGSGKFHGAIDVSTKSQPDVAALAMFNVRLVESNQTSITGWYLKMQINDDYSYEGKNWKGLYLVYFHLAEESVKYLIREGYIKSKEYLAGTVIPAGKPVGIVGGTGIDPDNPKKVKWKPGDGNGYHIHLHLHIQPKQNSEKGERMNLDKFFLDQKWYKRMAILAGKPYYDGL